MDNTLLKIQLKMLRSNPLVAFIAISGITLAIGNMVIGLTRILPDPMFKMRVMLITAPIHFVIFTILAFHFATEIETHQMRESFISTPMGYKRYLQTLFLLLFWIAVLFSVLTAGITAFFVSRSELTSILYAYRQSTVHFLLLTCIYLLIPAVIGICFGLSLSFLPNRLMGYLVIAIAFLLSYVINDLPAALLYELTGLNAYYPFELLRIGPEINLSPIYAFGYPAQIHQMARLLFWLCLFGGLLFWNLNRMEPTRRKWQIPFVGILAVLSIVTYFWPASRVAITTNPFYGLTADQEYYYKNPGSEQEADWTITNYELEVRIFRKLNVKATLILSQPVLGEMPFTLYHGYRVTDVRDAEGNKLSFRQEGDYLMVQSATETQQISITYSGSGDRYYSNEQGVSLPGSFVWYPHAGKKILFDNSAGGFIWVNPENDVSFRVAVKYPKKIYSNLVETEKGIWEGQSTGVTLMSGMLTEEVQSGIRFVYPYLNTELYAKGIRADLVNKVIQRDTVLDAVHSVISIAPVNLTTPSERFALLSDHLLLSNPLEYDDYIPLAKLRANKWGLHSMLKIYETDRDNFTLRFEMAKQAVKDMPEFEETAQDPYYRLGNLLQKDEEKVLQSVHAFLDDPDERRTMTELLTQLEGELQ